MSSKSRSDEYGAVLIIIALLSTVIVIFAAIVLDISLYSNSREQSSHYARLAALAALEQHFAEPASMTASDKADKALQRAREVTSQNFMLSDPQKLAQLGLDGAGDPGAILIPGRYYNARPCNDPGIPACDPCQVQGYPCFIRADLSNPDERITAYQVQGALYDGVSTRLAQGLFGRTSFPISVLATASVRPRQVCAVIDVSGSMTLQTHAGRTQLPFERTDPLKGHGVYFSYAPSESAIQQTAWSSLLTGPDRPGDLNAWQSFLPGVNLSQITEEQYRRMHFKNDYQDITTLGDGDYGTLSNAERGLFYDPVQSSSLAVGPPALTHTDVFRTNSDPSFPNFSYYGAEPLRTVFAGLRAAVDFFRRRGVAGDKMCMIFYNEKLRWSSFVRLSDDFDTLLSFTDFDDPTGFEKILKHRLLPLGADGGKTNTMVALNAALTELQQGNPDGGFASNSLVVIGDGLANCTTCPSPLPNPLPPGLANCRLTCPNPLPNPLPSEYAGCTSPGQTLTPGTICLNSFPTVDRAQQDLIAWAATALRDRNIPVNFILVGDLVKPHTLFLKNSQGQCMSDKEARQANLPYVRGGFGATRSCANACNNPSSSLCVSCSGAFNGMSTATPFYESNAYAYEIAVGTKGLWGPIRPKAPGCTPGVAIDCSSASTSANVQSAQSLEVDSLCRTPQEQIEDYMEDVIGGNPFALVEVGE